jgi:hypothetical protein
MRERLVSKRELNASEDGHALALGLRAEREFVWDDREAGLMEELLWAQ